MKHDCVVMKSIFSESGVSLARLQSLEKVVRAGSIARVAPGDATIQSQLSKQITDLEKTLGLQLLDRTRKPHSPTEAARRLADACGCFVREVEEVVAAASGLQRPITVGAGEVVIREFLIPKIGRQKKGKEPVRWVMRNLQRAKIQEGLAAEWLDVGIASGLVPDGNVKVVDLESYGFKLLLPEGDKPDKSGWKRLTDLPVAMLDGDAGFRQFVVDCCREQDVELVIGAECTSFPQAVDLAAVAGWAVFVPEYWWKREKNWAARTQKLPGLEAYQRGFQLGWNRKVSERRPEVAALVKALGKT
jgi:DNA-binding transcriptional LysR family regulator